VGTLGKLLLEGCLLRVVELSKYVVFQLVIDCFDLLVGLFADGAHFIACLAEHVIDLLFLVVTEAEVGKTVVQCAKQSTTRATLTGAMVAARPAMTSTGAIRATGSAAVAAGPFFTVLLLAGLIGGGLLVGGILGVTGRCTGQQQSRGNRHLF
jgi:hypothetical protein